MSATPVPSLRKQQEIRQPVVLPGETSAISPLLDLAILQTRVQGAYVYRFGRSGAEATLIAFVGPLPEKQPYVLPPALASLHSNRKSPVVLRSQAASDWRFIGFPELDTGRYNGIVSVPLLDSGDAVGLANFCLAGDDPLRASALSFLMNLSLPLGTLLIASALKDQLQKAHQDLVDRKVVERAKGILQSCCGWTEEEAYLRIRNLSRRNRTPMRKIAELVIESGGNLQAEAFNR
jgi:hypothetical protein